MSSEWKMSTLEDVAISPGGVVDGPFGSNLPASAYVDEGIPVIRGSNLSLGKSKFIDDQFVYVTESTYQLLGRSGCIEGDVIFTKKGTLGQTGIVPKGKHPKYLLSSNQMRLRIDQEKAIPLFVYYCVASNVTIEKIRRDSEHTGVPKINLAYLKSFQINLPPLAEQKRIAHILSSLDDKIHLNQQMNQTLEQMAQALFQSWFVDFDPVFDNCLAAGNPIPEPLQAKAQRRQQVQSTLPADIRALFPNRFVEHAEMGWIPDGWGVSNTGAEFSIKGGGTPSTSEPDFWEGGTICWTSPKDLSNANTKILFETERKITERGLQKISSGLLPINTILMSSRAPIGYLAIAKTPLAINQGYIALVCDQKITPEYALYWLDSNIEDIKSLGAGTTFAEISKSTFRTIPIMVPGTRPLKEYTSIAKNILDSIMANDIQIKELTTLRDTLLPKLISGELRVPEAARKVQEALR